MENKKSGKHWKAWADTNATNSKKMTDLAAPFSGYVNEFVKTLKDAGATVTVKSTRRSKKRAYLFHWAWKIALKKCKPKDAEKMDGVDIIWHHGDDEKSIAGAQEMVTAFGLAVPPKSKVAPSLTSNHIQGKAIDMKITWKGKLKVKKKGSKTEMQIEYTGKQNTNKRLIELGKSYKVIKHTSDEPHWSINGR